MAIGVVKSPPTIPGLFRATTVLETADGDIELVVNPPTPCKIGKHPPARQHREKKTAGQQGANGRWRAHETTADDARADAKYIAQDPWAVPGESRD